MCSWKQRDLVQVILQYLLVVPVTVVFQQNQSMIIIVRVMCMCWWNNYSVYYIPSSTKSNWTDLDHNRINMRNMKIYSREKGEQVFRGQAKAVVTDVSWMPQAKCDKADYITAAMSIFQPHHNYVHMCHDVCKRDAADIQQLKDSTRLKGLFFPDSALIKNSRSKIVSWAKLFLNMGG